MTPETRLLLVALAGVIGLVLLVAFIRVHAFLALALVSLGVGLGTGMAPAEVVRAFQEGVGASLGLIVVVVGLGTMLGRLLAESGGAVSIANALVNLLGVRRLGWAVLVAAFVVGMPVFFAVGLVLLIPVVFTLARTTGTPMLRLALPLLAGLSVCHTLVPPHPGPVVAVQKLGADMGWTILWSVIIGFPTAALVGPLLAGALSRRMTIAPGGLGAEMRSTQPPPRPAGWPVSLATILLPVALMLLSTAAVTLLPEGDPWRLRAGFLGSPLVAMLLAVLVALLTLGRHCGFSGAQVLKFTEDCLGPAASIFLVVGAGGGFSKVLDAAGIDDAIAAWGRDLALSPLLLGWLVAAALRVAVGSSTVAITLASAIVAPVAAAHPGTRPELLVVALGAGTLMLSHFNDGGFWFVKEYFGLTVSQTFRSWTVMVSLASVLALGLVLLADAIV